MIRQRVRKSLLASVVMVAAALPVRADDAAPAAINPPLTPTPAVGGGPQLSSACTPSSLSQPATPASSAPRSLVARYRVITLPPTF